MSVLGQYGHITIIRYTLGAILERSTLDRFNYTIIKNNTSDDLIILVNKKERYGLTRSLIIERVFWDDLSILLLNVASWADLIMLS